MTDIVDNVVDNMGDNMVDNMVDNMSENILNDSTASINEDFVKAGDDSNDSNEAEETGLSR